MHQLIVPQRSYYLFAQVSVVSWWDLSAVHLDLTYSFFISATIQVKSDFWNRVWVFVILPSTFMIPEYSCQYCMLFFTRSLVSRFSTFDFVIIDWRILCQYSFFSYYQIISFWYSNLNFFYLCTKKAFLRQITCV